MRERLQNMRQVFLGLSIKLQEERPKGQQENHNRMICLNRLGGNIRWHSDQLIGPELQQQLIVNTILMSEVQHRNRSINKNVLSPSQQPFQNFKGSLSRSGAHSMARKMSSVSTACGSMVLASRKTYFEAQAQTDKPSTCIEKEHYGSVKMSIPRIQSKKGCNMHMINHKINAILDGYPGNDASPQQAQSNSAKKMSNSITVSLSSTSMQPGKKQPQDNNKPKGKIVSRNRGTGNLGPRNRCLTDITDCFVNHCEVSANNQASNQQQQAQVILAFESQGSVKLSCSILDIDLIQLERSAHNSQCMLQSLENEYLRANVQDNGPYLAEEIKIPKVFRKRAAPSVPKGEPLCGEKARFLKAMNKQILLDERFNNAKGWFKTYRKQHKWWLLERQLKKRKLWIHELGMKALFSSSDNQYPFDKDKHSEFTIKGLIEAYLEAQEHWSKKICSSFELKRLQEQGFVEESLDLCRKGYISIEDLTRFVNVELKTFYHIRQLELIYLRWKNSNYLQFFDILQTICHARK